MRLASARFAVFVTTFFLSCASSVGVSGSRTQVPAGTNGTAQTRTSSQGPIIVVVAARGLGFPYENPPEARASIKRLRQSSRIFEAAFASATGGNGLAEALLFGLRATPGRKDVFERPSLVTQAKKSGIKTVLVGPSLGTTGQPAFDQTVAIAPEGLGKTTARALSTIDSPSLVYVNADFSAAPPLKDGVETPIAAPFQGPAIALFDRAPLDAPGELVAVAAPSAADRGQRAAKNLGGFAKLDQELAPILDAVDAKKGRPVVLVLATSGGSSHAGRPPIARNDLLFEDALRCLLLVRAPMVTSPGVATASPVELADVGVTLGELLGNPLDGERDGVSLASVLRDAKAQARETVLTMAEREPPLIGRTVRSATHRYTLWPDGSEELYDETADPREWKNLADSPTLIVTRSSLRAQALVRPEPLAAEKAKPRPRRPNVLVIIGDDHASHIEQFATPITPNLDRLKTRGRSFTRAYSAAPTCVPSRAAFLSGLSPQRLELQRTNPWEDVFARVPLVQEHFRAEGYFTAAIGKVWDSEPGASRGFDVNVWTPDLAPGQEEKPPKVGVGDILSWGGPTENADAVEPDGRRARYAAQLIKEKRDKPFFLVLGLIRPHMDWVAPQKYFDLYSADRIRFEKAPVDDGGDIPAIAVKNRPQELPGLMLRGREPGGFINDDMRGRSGVAMYLAALSFMDAQVGVILDELEKEKLWDNTVVVYLGDNGHHFGDHGGLWRKDTLFEDSLRVPLVFAGPGVEKPGQTEALADLLDIFPTLVDLTGVARPGTLDGRSLSPVLKDSKASVHEVVRQYRAAASPWRGFSIRTATHRYTLWPDGSEELYEIGSDPAGLTNLVARPQLASLRRELRSKIEKLVPPLR